ncbi:MAG TPA: isoprenyl transferase [Candidatus Omnitrophica bacterium]|nr:isoprenyl transferase [Candidatus Omnitrophota bacterium]
MVPKHIAIIMDGNGRWAKEHHLPRSLGHREGALRVKEIMRAALDLGVKVLTIFAFSTENWNRPKKEVDMLMNYFGVFLKKNEPELNKRGVRLRIIGRRDRIPKKLKLKFDEVIESTSVNSNITLNLAIDYGSRYEIVSAVKTIARKAKEDIKFNLESIDEKYFSDHLYTKDLPDPDLLIRTSGEERLSNFMLWQLSYTELYFYNKPWPDFKKKDFIEAVEMFNKRSRRFGKIK